MYIAMLVMYSVNIYELNSVKMFVQLVFPGCCLSEITPDLYKVNAEVTICTIIIFLFVSYSRVLRITVASILCRGLKSRHV